MPAKQGRLRFTPLPSHVRTGGPIRRYILTAAQNDTPVNAPVWLNLRALAEHYDARILVGRFIYNLDAQGQAGQEKDNSETAKRLKRGDPDARWWAPEILPYVSDERVSLAPDLEWCGHINILPTAVNPLSDLHNYTGRHSAVFPHPKIALESIPTGKLEPTKMNYTTGAVTERNYIQRKAGQKAEFHHSFGGLLIEVDERTGDWWARQLNADSSGAICDLTLRADKGVVTDRHAIEALNWGDIHLRYLEPWMRTACWGAAGVLDTLRPRFQLMHDLLHFETRSHHEMRNSHEMFRKWSVAAEDVRVELAEVRDFLVGPSWRAWCQTVVVDSNHDNALMRWLREGDYRGDPVNAQLFLRLQTRVYEAIASGETTFHVVEWALQDMGVPIHARFLRTDEAFPILDDDGNGIECGMHGHLGPNGARGAPVLFTKTGVRMNVGHTHSAQIREGVYVAGVQGALDQGYNAGMSSWSQSMIATYSNGKRAILTFRNQRWRA